MFAKPQESSHTTATSCLEVAQQGGSEMVCFSYMMRALLVGVTFIVLTSASAAAQEVALDGDTPGLISTVDRGGRLAPAYCQESQATHDRLSALLEKMKTDNAYKEAKRRTQALIRSSEADRLAADKEAQDLVRKAALGEIVKFGEGLKSVNNLVDKALRRYPEKYQKVIRDSASHVKEMAMNLDKLEKSAKAGAEFGIDMQNTSRSLSKSLENWEELLKRTGIFEEIHSVAGENLAELFFGPVAALAFRAANFSVSYIAATEKGFISDRVRNQAMQNLEGITFAQRKIESNLPKLESILKECQLADKRDQQREDQQANVGGGGSNGSKIPMLVGTAAAVGGGLIAASQIDFSGLGSGSGSGSSSSSCGSSPFSEVNAACFPFSSACNAATAKMNAWCVCNGFSSFNVNTGGCQ